MDSKETIMEAAISLIEEKGDCLEEITMREISKRAGVGLGHQWNCRKIPRHERMCQRQNAV